MQLLNLRPSGYPNEYEIIVQGSTVDFQTWALARFAVNEMTKRGLNVVDIIEHIKEPLPNAQVRVSYYVKYE